MLQARINKQATITLQNIQIYRRIMEQKTTFKRGDLGSSSTRNSKSKLRTVSYEKRANSQSMARMGSKDQHRTFVQNVTAGQIAAQQKKRVFSQNLDPSVNPMIRLRNLSPTVRTTDQEGTFTRMSIMEFRKVSPNMVRDFKVSMQYCERPNEPSTPKLGRSSKSKENTAFPRLGHLFHERKPSVSKTSKASSLSRGRISQHDTSQMGTASLISSSGGQTPVAARSITSVPWNNEYHTEHRWLLGNDSPWLFRKSTQLAAISGQSIGADAARTNHEMILFKKYKGREKN